MNERYALADDRRTVDRGTLALTLTALDRAVTWWGAHRAWPANEPVRIPERGRACCG